MPESEYIDKLSTSLIPVATGLESISLDLPDSPQESISEQSYHKMQEISHKVADYYKILRREFDAVDGKSKHKTLKSAFILHAHAKNPLHNPGLQQQLERIRDNDGLIVKFWIPNCQ